MQPVVVEAAAPVDATVSIHATVSIQAAVSAEAAIHMRVHGLKEPHDLPHLGLVGRRVLAAKYVHETLVVDGLVGTPGLGTTRNAHLGPLASPDVVEEEVFVHVGLRGQRLAFESRWRLHAVAMRMVPFFGNAARVFPTGLALSRSWS